MIPGEEREMQHLKVPPGRLIRPEGKAGVLDLATAPDVQIELPVIVIIDAEIPVLAGKRVPVQARKPVSRWVVILVLLGMIAAFIVF